MSTTRILTPTPRLQSFYYFFLLQKVKLLTNYFTNDVVKVKMTAQ